LTALYTKRTIIQQLIKHRKMIGHTDILPMPFRKLENRLNHDEDFRSHLKLVKGMCKSHMFQLRKYNCNTIKATCQYGIQ
jgi:cell fate (sporulation/competence/biofilm development) regulator YmcA (YheA/YmcA/DUF963 family)